MCLYLSRLSSVEGVPVCSKGQRNCIVPGLPLLEKAFLLRVGGGGAGFLYTGFFFSFLFFSLKKRIGLTWRNFRPHIPV